ncbi:MULTISPECIES: hypothetical protein [Bacillus]|uniref:hypothetical protein n=1 Tax=Bacillus TaxID=1386 RepID=UPI00077AC601|nr:MULTISPECIES: hypothetical protein [Bacillus cereus group]KXY70687.1 hypothetical protein AT270_27205 [Bacillus cereus]MBG9937529.1 hypothetical protein [Bacillus tropicus]MED2993810.1 hypothetical protein [Bacillus tropicus]OTY56528.1 hypothetical protein BK748_15445 [Bacillus thuringiensis serovar graciosensis]
MSIETPISRTLKFACPVCGHSFEESVEIINLEETGSDDREMGTEYQYDFIVDIKCTAKECRHSWEQEGELWEYPVGKINLIELNK